MSLGSKLDISLKSKPRAFYIRGDKMVGFELGVRVVLELVLIVYIAGKIAELLKAD